MKIDSKTIFPLELRSNKAQQLLNGNKALEAAEVQIENLLQEKKILLAKIDKLSLDYADIERAYQESEMNLAEYKQRNQINNAANKDI